MKIKTEKDIKSKVFGSSYIATLFSRFIKEKTATKTCAI
jgi:hypothetical protein